MGTQFILLAFLNSFAAACGGETVHHWSGIPIDAERGSQDMQRFALKLQAMRVIVLDEFPMISAELMGKLERSCRKCMAFTNTYKRRFGGKGDMAVRAWGGLNVLLAGDFWQHKPVTETPHFARPSSRPHGIAHAGLDLFWGFHANSITHLFELSEPMRCQDDFYNTFLQQCREGVLDQDVYAFVHGLPTSLVGSADVVTKEVVCGQDSCVLLQRETWRDMFLQGKRNNRDDALGV